MRALTQIRAVVGNDSRIEIYLFSDGRVMVSPGYGFTVYSEQDKLGISGLFDSEGFDLWEQGKDAQSYEYNVAYPYKQMPVFKAWLSQQELQMPT